MKKAGGRCVAALAVTAAMALVPSAAMAQSAPWWHSTPDPDYAFQTAYGTVFAVVLSQLDDQSNQQTFSGHFNGSPVGGVVVNHFYDATADSGTYLLAGEVAGPTGSPLPAIATISVTLDRTKGNYVTSVSASFGGVPFADVDRTFENPFYGIR